MYRLFLFLIVFASCAYSLSCFVPRLNIDTISDGVVTVSYSDLTDTATPRGEHIVTRQMLLDSIAHLRIKYSNLSIVKIDSMVRSTIINFTDENSIPVTIEIFGPSPDTIRYNSFILYKGGCPTLPGQPIPVITPYGGLSYCIYDTRPMNCGPSVNCIQVPAYATVYEKQNIHLTVKNSFGGRPVGTAMVIEYIETDKFWFIKNYESTIGLEFLVFADGPLDKDVVLNFGPPYGCQFSVWGFQVIDGRINHQSFPGVSVSIDELRSSLVKHQPIYPNRNASLHTGKTAAYTLDGRRTHQIGVGINLSVINGRIAKTVVLR